MFFTLHFIPSFFHFFTMTTTYNQPSLQQVASNVSTIGFVGAVGAAAIVGATCCVRQYDENIHSSDGDRSQLSARKKKILRATGTAGVGVTILGVGVYLAASYFGANFQPRTYFTSIHTVNGVRVTHT